MAKRAVLIGCNYPGTKAELHGCVNDVSRMYKCLVDRFGFEEDDITVLVDTDTRSVQPTGANIKKVISRVIAKSEPGDVLVLHYSGHGTQVPAESGDEEDDGLDEAVVPTDLNLLTDDDFRMLFKGIQDGVKFTFISDSCHSGGLIDQETEQIGGGDAGDREFKSPVPATSRVAARSYEEGNYGRAPGNYEGEEGAGYGGGYGASGGYGQATREYEEPREERHGHHHQARKEQHGGPYGNFESREQIYSSGPYGGGRREESGGYGGGRREESGGYGGGYERREEEGYGGGYERRQEESYGGGYGGDERRGQGYGHQEHGRRHERREEEEESGGYERPVRSANKSLSIETLTEMLSEQSGHQVQPGNIRTSLYDLFGEDASPTVKVFVNLIASRLGGGGGGGEAAEGGGGVWGSIGGLALNFMKTKLNDSDSSYTSAAQVASQAVSHSGHAGRKPPSSERVADGVGVLVSGCQSNETSADANPTGDASQAYGALSNGIQTILAETRGPITNGDLVTKVRAVLKKQGFSQHPCLYCNGDNVDTVFISE